MGGINHQPCSKYLLESTRLSRYVSLARASFEQANAALEDIIILELQGSKGAIGPVNHHLMLSNDHVVSACAQLQALREKMKVNDYKDLPPLAEIDLEQLGNRLSEAAIVDHTSWKKMSTMMRERSFYGNVVEFETQLLTLLDSCKALQIGIASLGEQADKGNLHLVLEENQEGNIKVEFARVYSAWNQFNADFLASSLVSTEVWYLHKGFGSLVPATALKEAVA
jgi:hypothetical protein